MREKLKEDISIDEDIKIRRKLHEFALKNYKPKYQDQYLKFMNENPCKFTINNPQNENFPYYFTLFTVTSQHVMGDCIEECLDNAIETK